MGEVALNILGPDGKVYEGRPSGTQKSPQIINPSATFQEFLTSLSSAKSLIEASPDDVSTYGTKNKKDETNELLEKFANEFSTTANGLIFLIHKEPQKFIDQYARKYLNSKIANLVAPRYTATVKGIIEGVYDQSSQVAQYQHTLKSSAESEKLLKAVIEIYKLTKACSNKESNAKLMTLNYIFFLLKFIKFGEKKENLFSDEFLDFLISEYKTENDKDCKGFLEQFIAAYSKRIPKGTAHELLKKLNKECQLASNFAQTLFIKYPELKTCFESPDPKFQEIGLQEILERRDDFALKAMNSTDLLSKSGRKGKLGFEIEMRLLEEPKYYESFSSPLNKFKYFSCLKQDVVLGQTRIKSPELHATWHEYPIDISNHHELYSYGKGFKLNEFSFPALFQINQEFSFNPNFISYGSNHIHVDQLSTEARAANFSIINFRRGNYNDGGAPYNKGWEASELALAKVKYPQPINNIESLFFDTARFYDQMQIINGLYDIEVKEKDIEEFYSLLNQDDKEQIQHTSKNFFNRKSQDLLSKFYLFIAKKYQREDLIPHILRSWKNLQLPNLSQEAYKKLLQLKDSPQDPAIKKQPSIRDSDLPHFLILFNGIRDKSNFTNMLLRSADFTNKLDMVCRYITNESGLEWKPLLQATKQVLSIEKLVNSTFYLNRFKALYLAGVINSSDLNFEYSKTILKYVPFSDIPDKFYRGLISNCPVDELQKLLTIDDIDEQIKSRIRCQLILELNAEDREERELENSLENQISLDSIQGEKVSFAELGKFYIEKKDYLNDKEKFLTLYHGYNIYKKEHEDGNYPYLDDLQSIIDYNPGLLWQMSSIDCKHPALKFYLKGRTPPLTDTKSKVAYACDLFKKISIIPRHVKFINLVNSESSDSLENLILRLSLLLLKKIHISEIPLMQIFHDHWNINLEAPGFIRATGQQRVLLSDLAKGISENHKLNFSDYKDLYAEIIFYTAFTNNNHALEFASLKKIIAKKLSALKLSEEQINELEQIAQTQFIHMPLINFEADQFYLIASGKLIPKQKFKLQDENLKQFLKELSSYQLVTGDLNSYIEEFDFAELKNFISKNPDISQENIAQLIKNLKPTKITFAEAEPYITNYAVHPKIRSAIFRLIDPQSLKTRIKQGYISAKC